MYDRDKLIDRILELDGKVSKQAERIKTLESLLISCAADFGRLADMFKLEDDNSMKNACLKTQAKIKKILTQ